MYLYTNNPDTQHMYISKATEKNYQVLVLDSPIVSHVIQKLESKLDNASFVRVDSDIVDNLKFRASYGESGDSNIGLNQYQSLFGYSADYNNQGGGSGSGRNICRISVRIPDMQ